MNLPLTGRHIVITRPLDQAAPLSAAIRAQGGEPVIYPVLAISPVADTTALHALAGRLGDYQWAFFVSPNAVEHALAHLPHPQAAPGWPASLRVATVGPSSAAALTRYGFANILVPEQRFDSEAVLALPEFQTERIAGQRVLILRGDGGRELLADTLRARGATVDHVSCYQRTCPATSPDVLLALHAQGRLDALTLTSSEGLHNLIRMLGTPGWPTLADVPTFVPHARIAEQARRAGFRQVHLTGPADAGLLSGLCAILGTSPARTVRH